MPNFENAATAAHYAKHRPPLHERIVERIGVRAALALDVGCGAGLSTRPLHAIAERVAGVDPAREMIKWARIVDRRGRFAVARSEALPFRDGSFDLITAAGSLNYADPARAFPELRRVITSSGTLCVYDFDQEDFAYERPPDGAIPLDPEILATVAAGFRVARSEPFRFSVTMTMCEYAEYLHTETGTCITFGPEDADEKVTLWFGGYIAWLTPASL